MKRIVSLMLCLAALLCLSACGSNPTAYTPTGNALDPDDLDVTDVDTRPDPDVYEDAMQHIIDGERTRDITIAGTDADLVTFLRAKASPEADEKNAEAADREFLGIGYLFSEAEYEAIMAQYNEDGSQSPVYDTETRAFDQVGSKE